MVELTLHKPITTQNGTELKSFDLDFEALTTADFRAAQKLRALISDAKQVDTTELLAGLRLDSEFQVAVGFIAACKGTKGLTQADFLRLCMKDALMLGEAASDYFFE